MITRGKISTAYIAFVLFAATSALLALSSFLTSNAAASENTSAPLVLEWKLDGVVAPILANYIDEGLADAANRKAALVLITMDTPGGLSDSMTDIVQHILESPVPVVVFVAPTGSRGAAAGFFILLSADVGAMALSPHAGAST